jgi:NitT/TauT family transport system substrate-binding protein
MDQSNGASPARSGRRVNSPKARFSKLACALLAPAVLAGVAACSSGGGGGSSSVTMALTIAAPTSAPAYIAQSLGYFKQQGLNVKVKITPEANESLATGQIQFGLIGVAQVIEAASNGTPLQQVCVTQTSPDYVLAVSQKTMDAKGITSSMSLKETLTKLQGEVVTEVGGAVNPGSILLRSLLTRNGLPSDWIKVVSETSTASATASFIEGQVGVVFQPQPEPDALLAKVPGKIIFTTGGSSLFSNLDGTPWSGVAASSSYVAANPTVVKEVCKAIGEANNYILAHPAQAAKDIQPQMSSVPEQAIAAALPTYKFAPNAVMSESKWDAGVKALASYGIFAQPSSSVLGSAYSTKYQS